MWFKIKCFKYTYVIVEIGEKQSPSVWFVSLLSVSESVYVVSPKVFCAGIWCRDVVNPRVFCAGVRCADVVNPKAVCVGASCRDVWSVPKHSVQGSDTEMWSIPKHSVQGVLFLKVLSSRQREAWGCGGVGCLWAGPCFLGHGPQEPQASAVCVLSACSTLSERFWREQVK